MTEPDFEDRRVRLDHTPRTEWPYSHGDLYRDVTRRPGVVKRFRRWMIWPWHEQ